MSTWIRTDVDFGAPYCTFVLNYRSNLGQEFMQQWRMNIEDASGANLQAILVEKFIEGIRPELKGCMVIGMMLQGRFDQLKFQVIHPSLERMKVVQYKEERLELCPVCGKSLSMEERWLRQENYESYKGYKEVCSEACVTGDIPQDAYCIVREVEKRLADHYLGD